jgi:SNF2 family DNA or RNA helicase
VAVLQKSSWVCHSNVALTTYNKVCLYTREIAASAFQRVVLDEGHAIRNGKSTIRWTACMAVAREATCRWILSATPIQNGGSDWRNLCAWLRTVESASEIMLRRTMDELRGTLPLPPPPRFVVHDLNIPAETKEGKLFRILCDQLDSLVEKKSLSAFIKLELWMRIQQFTVHPQIYIDAMRAKNPKYPRPDWSGTATKWSACMRELAVAVEESVPTIVFCNFRREMDLVAFTAERMGASVFSVRGGSLVGEEVAAAKEAVAAGKPVVVIVQIVCGGAGLNLQFCRNILFLSQHWNPAVVHQAIGRAVRLRQEAVVEVHMFGIVDDVMDNVDRRMRELHGIKIEAAKEICDSFYMGFPTQSLSST